MLQPLVSRFDACTQIAIYRRIDPNVYIFQKSKDIGDVGLLFKQITPLRLASNAFVVRIDSLTYPIMDSSGALSSAVNRP